MTYPYHQRENWMKPPYQRSPLKRRCSSPSLFPRKVHISEEKVAEELGNLSLRGTQSHPGASFSSQSQKPEFLLNGTRRLKTFQEIEDSIEIDGICEGENSGLKGTVQLAPELASEINKQSRKYLSASSYRLSPKRILVNPCQQLVLWMPPAGSITEVLNAVRKAALAQEVEEDTTRNSGLRLDRIDEESRSEVEDCSMSGFTDEQLNPSLPKSLLRTPYYTAPHQRYFNDDQRTTDCLELDDSSMEMSMEL